MRQAVRWMLADVYLALDERLVSNQQEAQQHECSIEHALHDRVANVMAEIEESLVEHLRATTIAEVREQSD